MMSVEIHFIFGKIEKYILSRSFRFRSHFSFNPSEEKNHLSIRINDVFHVINTLHNDQVGSWTGRKVNTKESIIGILPNQSRFFFYLN